MTAEDFILTKPLLLTTGRMVRLSTEDDPTVDDEGAALQVGQELLLDDKGLLKYWDGDSWEPVTFSQKLIQCFEIQAEIRDHMLAVTSED